MNITASYTAYNDRIHLQYDAEAQAILLKTLPIAKRVCRDPDVRKFFAEHGHIFCARMKVGGELLRLMAENSDRQVDFSMVDFHTVTELVLFAASYCAETDKAISSLREAVMLLARVTPYELPAIALPPTTEVFSKTEVTPAVWESFEVMRRQNRSGPPCLRLVEMYDLWFALQSLQPTNGQLQTLVACLEMATRLFRSTMQALAAKDVSVPEVKLRRKRRKA